MLLVEPLKGLQGPLLLTPKLHCDDRGWFREGFKQSILAAHGIHETFVQANESRSKVGVIRGLHLQVAPKPQAKLVWCSEGRILDVIVDVRPGSPTYGQHATAGLDAEIGQRLWIPRGFAHGFQALTDATLCYLITAEYDQPSERSVRFDDPALGIRWPLPNPILSAKDAQAPLLKDANLA